MKPEDRKRLKQHIEMIVEHKLPEEDRVTETIGAANQKEIDFWRGKFEEAREEIIKIRADIDEVHLARTSSENAAEIIQEMLDTEQDENSKLRLELHTLRFKESQEQRFIWWVWNVYSRNVCDLIYAIMGATTYDTEDEAKEGKYALPKHCFDLMKRIDEYTEHIYDGTYLDNETSTVVKRELSDAEIEELGAQEAEKRGEK